MPNVKAWHFLGIYDQPQGDRLLQGLRVGGVFRRLLVQVRNHFLSGGRNRNSPFKDDGFGFDLLPIEAFVGVIVGANRRAFQREAGE